MNGFEPKLLNAGAHRKDTSIKAQQMNTNYDAMEKPNLTMSYISFKSRAAKCTSTGHREISGKAYKSWAHIFIRIRHHVDNHLHRYP